MDDYNSIQLSSVLDDLGSPVVLRRCLNYLPPDNSRAASTVKQLKQELEFIHKGHMTQMDKLLPILLNEIDTARYNLSTEPLCIVEEDYLRHSGITWNLYDVEGCISNSDFIPWAITDLHTS